MDSTSSIELQMTAKSLEESVIGNGRFPEKILQKLDIFANFYIGSHIKLEGTGFHTLPTFGLKPLLRTQNRQNES